MANEKLTDQPELTGTPAVGDFLHIVDLTDNTSKKITVSNLMLAAPGGSGVTAVTGTAPIVSSGGTTPAVSISAATTSAAGSMSSADKTKLDGIATGAEVNVNADWNASSGDAEILNKPNLNVLDGVILEYTTRTAAYGNGSHEGEILKINSDTLSYGKVYQLLSTGWAGTLASSAARSVGLLGWALGTNSGTNGLFHKGIIESSTFSFTAGDTLYLSSSSEGLLTATAPTTSTHVVRVMGYAITSTRIYFNPSPTFIQVD